MDADRVKGEVLDHVLDLRVLPQLTLSGPFPVQVPVEGHHSLGEGHEVVHQLVERREVNRVLSLRAREFLVEPEPRRSCSAGQARPKGDVQSVSVRALQLLHGVVEALRSGQAVRDGQADGGATLVVEALVAQAGVLPAAVLHEEPVGEALVRSANRRRDDRDLARGDGHEQTIIELVRTNCRSSVFVESCCATLRSVSHLAPCD